MRTPNRWIPGIVSLLLILIALAGCTRDRPTPEPTPAKASTSQEPVAVQLTSTPEQVGQPTTEPTPTPPSQKSVILYRVEEGESISSIAEKFNTTVLEIRQLNLLADDNILVGQILQIPEPPPTPTPEPYRYVVKDGDTLGTIAEEHGVSMDTLLEANNLIDPNNVFVGQELFIPGYVPLAAEAVSTSATTMPAIATIIHVVEQGESLSQIAERYGIPLAELMEANDILDPNLIAVGDELVVPGVAAMPEKEPQQAVHVVRAGETLLGIARLYGVDARDIAATNSLRDPDLLTPGQELVIPGVRPEDVLAAQQTVHMVQAGETLFGIARQYNVAAGAIARANNIQDPDRIRVGQKLIIPQE